MKMVAAVDLNYNELMDLPLDEFLEVRKSVVDITDRRNAAMRSTRRG